MLWLLGHDCLGLLGPAAETLPRGNRRADLAARTVTVRGGREEELSTGGKGQGPPQGNVTLAGVGEGQGHAAAVSSARGAPWGHA